jgi:hypothetical protein
LAHLFFTIGASASVNADIIVAQLEGGLIFGMPQPLAWR